MEEGILIKDGWNFGNPVYGVKPGLRAMKNLGHMNYKLFLRIGKHLNNLENTDGLDKVKNHIMDKGMHLRK